MIESLNGFWNSPKVNRYEKAYKLIEDMLTDKRPMDFSEAVFAVENCMYDGKLDHASYLAELNRIAAGIKHILGIRQ